MIGFASAVALVVCYMRQKVQRATSFVSRRASGGDGEDSSTEPQSRGELGEIECKIICVRGDLNNLTINWQMMTTMTMTVG
jgi:hypothetical protein